MNIKSTLRFAIVAAIFTVFFFYPVFVTVICLSLPVLSDFCKWVNTEYAAKPVSAYDELKSAFDDIFEEPEQPAPIDLHSLDSVIYDCEFDMTRETEWDIDEQDDASDEDPFAIEEEELVEEEVIEFSYRELQQLIKGYYSEDERASLGIKLNTKKAELEGWLPEEYTNI